MGSPDTLEYPAAGLLVYDMLGTGEPPIDTRATPRPRRPSPSTA